WECHHRTVRSRAAQHTLLGRTRRSRARPSRFARLGHRSGACGDCAALHGTAARWSIDMEAIALALSRETRVVLVFALRCLAWLVTLELFAGLVWVRRISVAFTGATLTLLSAGLIGPREMLGE